MVYMLIALPLVVVLGALAIWAAIRSARQDENRIRLWADEQGGQFHVLITVRGSRPLEMRRLLDTI